MTEQPRRKLMSIEETAEYLDLNITTIRRRIAEGTLKAYKIAGTRAIRLDLKEVDALLTPIPTAGVGDVPQAS